MPNKTKLPALKNIPPKTDRELKIALDSIKEALEVRLGQRGDPLDRAVTLRELSDSGIIKVRNKGNLASDILPPGDDDPGGNLDIPPAPTGLSASGVFTAVILDWNEAPYNNHAYTEIWRSQANALGGAVRIATTVGNVYTDEVGYATTYYYWIRFVSTSNVIGPFNGTEGKEATTAANVSAVMTTLSEQLSSKPGFTTLQNDITVNVGGVSSTLASPLGTLDTEVATAQTAANNAQTAANNAQTSANNAVTGATQVIQSTSAPTTRDDGSALQAHDIWIDTDDNNQAYVRNSSNNGWEKARDSSLVSTIGSASFTGSDLTTAMASAQSSIITINSTNTSQASAITTLENTVNDGTTGVAATATALSNLTTRVTNTENATSTNTSDITALETTVNHPSTGVAATSTALNNLTTGTVATNTGNIATNASDIAAL